MKKAIVLFCVLCLCSSMFSDDKKIKLQQIPKHHFTLILPDLILGTVRINYTNNNRVLSGYVYNCGTGNVAKNSVTIKVTGYRWISAKKRYHVAFVKEIKVTREINAKRFATFSLQLGNEMVPGRDVGYIELHVDHQNKIKESNEANNTAHEIFIPVQ